MNKPFSSLFILIINSLCFELSAGNFLPCSANNGNQIVARTSPDFFTRGFNVALGSSCEYLVPDMRRYWSARAGSGWRVSGSIRQIPEPNTRVSIASGTCTDKYIKVVITADFHFNNGTAINPWDDRYCSVDILDSFFIQDKISPVARPIAISSSIPSFSADNLKSFFSSAHLSDNCTPLAILRNNLEIATDPGIPTEAGIRCGSANLYLITFRTRDACGNYSNWALGMVRFVDHIPPTKPTITPFISDYYLNDDCTFLIRPNHFDVHSADDHTPANRIIYSYRIISPLNLRGDLPTGGVRLSMDDACPASTSITLRVCAQDCFGNGNLHRGDNILDVNCDYITLNLRDTTAPRITSPCDSIIELLSNCTAVMPNLAASLTSSENCSAVSIYQLPAPGSVLNNGAAKSIGLAQGPPRIFNCNLANLNDDYVDCNNSMGVFKSIPVSFIVVDCDGNCTVRSNCLTINLKTATPSLNHSTVDFTSTSAGKEKLRYSNSTEFISLTNQPQSFH